VPDAEKTPADIPFTLKELIERARDPIESLTCYDCCQWAKCEFAFDGYNTDGDCLADK